MATISKLPGADLTLKQKKAARALLARRPAVLPGTRAIIDPKEQKRWYDDVATVMVTLDTKPEQIEAFCDLAGVPD